MKITRKFAPADRYTYDFGLCNYQNGWAQVYCAGCVVLRHLGQPDPPDDLQLL